MGLDPQTFDAWFVRYPSTHVNAGQSVEVVGRAYAENAVAVAERRGYDRAVREIVEWGRERAQYAEKATDLKDPHMTARAYRVITDQIESRFGESPDE